MKESTKNTNGLILGGSPAKSLFLGKILEENVFPFPTIKESEAETLRMVIESIDKFMGGREAEFRQFDEKGAQPPDYIQGLRELGLFGLIIPEEFDGIGLSNSAYSRVIQQTTRHDASTSLTIGAHSSIGMKGLLLSGNDQQKKKYLPKLASGEMIAAFCLTEPGAGSDAASIKTHATKNADGSWTLNGEKIWITNGPIADYFTVFARTDTDAGKISAFIVERAFKGVTTGPKEEKLGIRASATSTVSFENVQVPAENLLGEEGKGFKVAMAILNNGRTGLGGGCVGAMKRCIALATKQASERKQFGRPIAEFGLVKEKIAQMTVNCFATEAVVSMVGHYIDSGVEDFSVEAAISKVYASEALWQSVNEALQIAGGNGFMKEFPYECIMRDSRINMIFEGTNEILRLYVALSGMKEAGDYLKGLSKSVGNIFNDPIKGFGVLSDYASKKLTHLTSIGRDKLTVAAKELRPLAEIIEEYTVELSKATEAVIRRYGKDVINQQFAMKRLGEVAIDLYVSLCVLARVTRLLEEKGAAACGSELTIANIFVQQAKRRINQNLRRVNHNEDEEMEALADFIVGKQSFPWDTI